MRSFDLGYCFSQSLTQTAIVLVSMVVAPFKYLPNVRRQSLKHRSFIIIDRFHPLEFSMQISELLAKLLFVHTR